MSLESLNSLLLSRYLQQRHPKAGSWAGSTAEMDAIIGTACACCEDRIFNKCVNIPSHPSGSVEDSRP